MPNLSGVTLLGSAVFGDRARRDWKGKGGTHAVPKDTLVRVLALYPPCRDSGTDGEPEETAGPAVPPHASAKSVVEVGVKGMHSDEGF